MTPEAWLALERLERSCGNPDIFRRILQATFSPQEDPLRGNRYWFSHFASYVEYVASRGEQLNENTALTELTSPGRWNQMVQPRQLVWASQICSKLIPKQFESVCRLPVVATTIPAFNASACRLGSVDLVLINLPLIFGLEVSNNILLEIMDVAGEHPTAIRLPTFAWNQALRERMSGLWARQNRNSAWISNPNALDFLAVDARTEHAVAGHNLVYLQVLFTLLHELAHFALDHLSARRRSSAEDQASARLLTPRTQADEVAADKLAFEWFMELSKGFEINGKFIKSDEAWRLLPIALVFFFLTLANLEGLDSEFGADIGHGEHPLALIRWATLCVAMKQDTRTRDFVEMQQWILRLAIRTT